MPPDTFIPPHGGYRDLLSYQKAEAVFDLTCRFCERFLRRGDRTIDQMVQAARSGKQNIAEGCQASGTSKEMEIKLIGVARASLEELLNDYLDYLRTRRLPLWDKDSKEALFIRRLGRSTEPPRDEAPPHARAVPPQTHPTQPLPTIGPVRPIRLIPPRSPPPSTPTASSPTPAPTTSSPTSPSASSTRRTTCSTSSSARSNRPS